MKGNSIVIKLILVGLIVAFFSHFFYQIYFVHGISMEPTLHDKEMILIKKYNLDINYNDIVIVKKNNKIIIKRVVGIPNDTIEINHYLYRNGQKIDDYYINDDKKINVTLKEDEYFILGDNRNESIDSRSEEIGIINKNNIIGKKM